MKVIKKTDISNWSYKHKCSNCETELEVEKGDLIYHYYDGDYRDPSYETFSALCAVCKQSFNIPNNYIPKLMQSELRSKQKLSSLYWDR